MFPINHAFLCLWYYIFYSLRILSRHSQWVIWLRIRHYFLLQTSILDMITIYMFFKVSSLFKDSLRSHLLNLEGISRHLLLVALHFTDLSWDISFGPYLHLRLCAPHSNVLNTALILETNRGYYRSKVTVSHWRLSHKVQFTV